jgi:hypothetical protein
MTRRFGALLAAFALALAIPAAMTPRPAAAQSSSAPRLVLAEPLKDFGTVAKGQTLEWAFPVRNTGGSDLQILAARPNCGCTVVSFDKVIRPGQTGRVQARVDTSAFAGPISKSIQLETSDPSNPAPQLTITAVVKPYVEAYPAGYLRYSLLQGQEETQAITLYSEDVEPFEIVSASASADWIKVRTRKLAGADLIAGVGRPGQNQHRIEVTVGGASARPGPISEKIRIVTSSKAQPEYLLSISGVMRPPYRVDPTAVSFGEVAPGDAAATRAIRLRSNNLKAPQGFSVSRAVSDVPGLGVEVRPTDRAGEYEVTLQVTRSMAPGAFAGTVKIQTNDPVNPLATIAVKGVVKSGG